MIPKSKWENTAMDFVVGLPLSQRDNDAIWIIVNRLTNSAHFLPMCMTHSTEKLAQLYVDEITWSTSYDCVQSRPTIYIIILEKFT